MNSEEKLNESFPVHWLQEILDKIEERDKSLITLSTGKTPSGHIHVGILREIIICDSLRRVLEDRGNNVRNLLFFDSLDAAKRFPDYIDKDFQQENLGKPFAYIPCPFEDCNCKSYAHHFGEELYSTFPDFGIKNELVWTHELYKDKRMLERIKISLQRVKDIKAILKKYILPTLDEEKKIQFLEMQKNWMPVMVVCEECDRLLNVKKDGSIRPNRIGSYNDANETVSYTCNYCQHSNDISIYSGRLKLNWRVDWPAKWSIFKTTCEPAGKDHSVKGGAYDTGLELCQKLFDYQGPVKVPYEWLRLGEYDMKTSKGIVFTPKSFLEVADPELYRMLILRTDPMKHISLRIEEIPQYYDYYEKIEDAYFSSENDEELKDLKYIYPLIKIEGLSKEKTSKIPFNLLVFLSQIQNILSENLLYEKAKSVLRENKSINIPSFENFKMLLKRTKNWIEEVKKIIENEKDPKVKRSILQKINIFEIPEDLDEKFLENLDEKQKKGITQFREYILQNQDIDEDEIQNQVFNIAKELEIQPRKMFQAFYWILLGKKFGPRLGSFISLLDREWLIKRLDIKNS